MDRLPFQAELLARLTWFTKLRWAAAAGAFIVVWAAREFLGAISSPVPLYLICGAIAFYNALFTLYARTIRRLPQDAHTQARVNVFGNVQVSLDLIALASLIYFSGGLENPFFPYFIFHMIVASILLSVRATYLQATLATVLFWSIGLLEYTGILPHVPLLNFGTDDLHAHGRYVGGVLFVFTSTLYFSVFVATSITRRLRREERELVRVKRSLKEANTSLQELDGLKSEYVLRVAHELKSPLATIASCLKVMSQGYVAGIGEKQRDMVARAERRTEGLIALVKDMLELSRIRTAGLIRPKELTNLCPVIRGSCDFLRGTAEEKGIVLRERFPCGSPEEVERCGREPCPDAAVRADRDSIEQLLGNLLTNAIKYTAPGGAVDINVRRKGETICVQVSDTGIGIPAADLTRIFEEFYRSENALAYDAQGTGMGLAIAKRVAQNHDGAIWADSRPGKGTTFNVILPLARGDQPA